MRGIRGEEDRTKWLPIHCTDLLCPGESALTSGRAEKCATRPGAPGAQDSREFPFPRPLLLRPPAAQPLNSREWERLLLSLPMIILQAFVSQILNDFSRPTPWDITTSPIGPVHPAGRPSQMNLFRKQQCKHIREFPSNKQQVRGRHPS